MEDPRKMCDQPVLSELGAQKSFPLENEKEGEKMASTDYSTYSQAAAQQGYSAHTAQPTQGYAQTTQAYGQQSYGTYGQPTDVSYSRLRPLRPMGRPPLQLLMDSLPLVILLQLPPRHTVSLSRGTALVLTERPRLRPLPPRPPVQLSLLMALSLLTQPMGSRQQPPHLQDRRMVTNPLRLVNLNLAQGVTTSPA
ncbi:hypothetical protein GH733_018384 [Mirounga leonina]|nr:hypothetical protein GH733_018384 [Mirounga leonina]